MRPVRQMDIQSMLFARDSGLASSLHEAIRSLLGTRTLAWSQDDRVRGTEGWSRSAPGICYKHSTSCLSARDARMDLMLTEGRAGRVRRGARSSRRIVGARRPRPDRPSSLSTSNSASPLPPFHIMTRAGSALRALLSIERHAATLVPSLRAQKDGGASRNWDASPMTPHSLDRLSTGFKKALCLCPQCDSNARFPRSIINTSETP